MSDSEYDIQPERHEAPAAAASAPERKPPGSSDLEAANQSLSDALRWSFRLLSAVMLLVVAGFLLSGFKSIEAQQVGIRKVFGAVSGPVAAQGLAYTWPWPVGEIEIVSISEHSFGIDEFWMFESPADKARKLSERRPVSAGLRPGWDGALFTGDRSLLHVRIDCKYRVSDALAYVRSVREDDYVAQPGLQEMIRAAVRRAAIHAAGLRTADSIRTTDRGDFADEVRERTQRYLNIVTLSSEPVQRYRRRLAEAAMSVRGEAGEQARAALKEMNAHIDAGDIGSALEAWNRLRDALPAGEDRERLARETGELLVTAVQIRQIGFDASWPLAALEAYNEAQRATQRSEQLVEQAVGRATEILQGVAGGSYVELVGRIVDTQAPRPDLADGDDPASGDEGLIQRYGRAVDAGSEQADALLQQINDVLLSERTSGEVSQLIAEARAQQTAVNEPIKAWHERFTALLEEYRRSPEIFLARYWTEVREEVLAGETNEKYTLNPSLERIVLRLRRPPEIAKSVREAVRRLATERRQNRRDGGE
jgi:regulator of protease activity HflC (stomatin/prohibitin superfamily)